MSIFTLFHTLVTLTIIAALLWQAALRSHVRWLKRGTGLVAFALAAAAGYDSQGVFGAIGLVIFLLAAIGAGAMMPIQSGESRDARFRKLLKIIWG